MPEIAVRERTGCPGRLNDRRRLIRLGVLTWLLPMLVISFLVGINPWHRSVTHLYHHAAAGWWAGKALYHGPGGMNYLPQFAVIFSPFHWLPVPVGDIVWRFCEAVVLAAGVWRFQGEKFGGDIARDFLYASLLTMPLCLAALRNGQANAMLAALTLYAAACLPRRQWWSAAVLIVLALGIKPLGIVLLLLSAAVYAPLRWRLVPALAALALLPFMFAPSDYVIAQFHAFIANIRLCAVVHQDRFADIGGIVRTFGWEMPNGVSIITRVAAGGAALALWLAGARRLREPFRAMWLLALTACYLMLFNPMNEANSYVILAPALGLWAVAALNFAPTRRFGWFTAAISLSMSLLPNLVRPLFGNYFALFWHPVMTFVFICMLGYWVLRADSPFVGMPAAQ